MISDWPGNHHVLLVLDSAQQFLIIGDLLDKYMCVSTGCVMHQHYLIIIVKQQSKLISDGNCCNVKYSRWCGSMYGS